MRLTLRTLLAWMDDTLPPSEVKEIGQQVKESPFATKLVEKLRQVTRRRRLAVPASSGPEATDPNLVAAYLDNELDADQVEKYEMLCLKSDVHLAEVASAHQILSMIRDKAKVPAEARYRMYRLIRGREAVRKNERGAAEVAGVGSGTAAPPWAPSEPRPVSVWARFGPPAAVAGLIGLLLWAGWLNLQGPPSTPSGPGPMAKADNPPPPAIGPAPAEVPPPVAEEPSEPKPEPEPKPGPGPEQVAEPEPEPDRAPVPVRAAIGGVVGKVESGDGLVLRRDAEDRTWERLENGTEVMVGDRLVHLAPLRSTLKLGPVQVLLVGEAEVLVGAPTEEEAARIDLVRGRVVLRDALAADPAEGASAPVALDETKPIGLGFGGKVLALSLPAGKPAGLEAFGNRPPGAAEGSMVLRILLPEGEAVLTPAPAAGSIAMQGPTVLALDDTGRVSDPVSEVSPRWVSEAEPPPADQRVGEAFLTLFGDGATEFSLLEGVSDERPEVQRLSVAALGATGNDELIMPLLSRPDSPALRQEALSVLQARLAERPDGIAALKPLIEQFSETPEVASDLEWMLIGFTPEQVNQRETFERLIRGLESPSPSVRELAILHLQGITRRDAQGYDPDKPEAGAKHWQGLLRDGKVGPARAATPPAPARGAGRPGS